MGIILTAFVGRAEKVRIHTNSIKEELKRETSSLIRTIILSASFVVWVGSTVDIGYLSTAAMFPGAVILAYVFMEHVSDEYWKMRYIETILICSFLTALWGIVQYAGYDPFFCVRALNWKCFAMGGKAATVGFIGNSNFFSIMMIPGIILGGILTGPFSVVAAFLGGSITAWAGIGVSAVFMLLGYIRRESMKIILMLQTVVVLMMILVSIRISMDNSISHTTLKVLDQKTSHRIHAWRIAGRMLKDNPVKGLGIGNFPLIYPVYKYLIMQPSPEGRIYNKSVYQPIYNWEAAHNEFIQAGAELGYPGLIAAIALFVLIAYRISTREHTKLTFFIAQAWFAMVITMIGHYTLRFPPTFVLFLLLTAMSVTLKEKITGADGGK
ncbi:MAG TPA: hypothetical protein DHN29_01250 [Cytophagales bacterium]|nr:hypothetical protein [Cytophagales bacterium]|tara:strand:- start:2790 stop:3935 length:1146 start_codon:yes stop_codon:yes gene_type:complete